LEHLDAGSPTGLRLLSARYLESAEEDVSELQRRGEVELLAGEIVDLLRKPCDRGIDFLGHDLELARVDGKTRRLHPREQRRERNLDLFVDAHLLALLELRAHRIEQTKRCVRTR